MSNEMDKLYSISSRYVPSMSLSASSRTKIFDSLSDNKPRRTNCAIRPGVPIATEQPCEIISLLLLTSSPPMNTLKYITMSNTEPC